jgi:hypothetical protein
MKKLYQTTDGQLFDSAEEAVAVAIQLCPGNPQVTEVPLPSADEEPAPADEKKSKKKPQ